MAKISERVKERSNDRTRNRSKRNTSDPKDFSHIQSSFTDIQREMYKKIASLNDSSQLSELNAAWEMGAAINDVVAEENTKTYGKRFFRDLAKLLNHSIGYLYERQRFYQRLPAAQFQKITSLRMQATGTPLTYSHVISVLDLPENVFWDYLEKAATFNYNVSQLKAMVREHKNSRNKKTGRGRAVNVPSDFKGQLDNIEQSLSPLLKRADQWTDDQKGVASALSKLPKDKLDPQWLARVGRVIEELEKATGKLGTLKSALAKAYESYTPTKEEPEEPKAPAWREDSTLAAMGFSA